MSEKYRQLPFDGWEQKEDKKPPTIYICREHQSVLVKDAFGNLECFEGGEDIVSEDQIYRGVGWVMSFENEDD